MLRYLAFLGLGAGATLATKHDFSRRTGAELGNKLPGESKLPPAVGAALHVAPGVMPTYDLAQGLTSGNPFSGPLLQAALASGRMSNPEDASNAFNSIGGTAEMLAGGAMGIPVLASEQAAQRVHELLTGWNMPSYRRPDQYLIPALRPDQRTFYPVTPGQSISTFLGLPPTR
jgi:hypothetical protein